MTNLNLDSFSAAVGESFEVAGEGGALSLTLIEAESISGAARDGGAFRLLFRGPFEPILPQATYGLTRNDAALDIFLVPIGQEESGTRYEAIFN